MFVRPKDALKLAGVSVMAFCAVFVCTIFLNFNLDITAIRPLIDSQEAISLYEAQVAMGKATSAISGGCLLMTTAVTLLFYIRQYVEQHRKELGVLKALGYSSMQLAKRFWIFSLSVCSGTALGFVSSHLLMPVFYREMTADILPEATPHMHLWLAVWLVVLPTAAFGLLAVLYACRKLRRPALALIREQDGKSRRYRRGKKEKKEADSFLRQMKKSTIKSRPALLFFVMFAAFCYSAMIQMTLVMEDIASELFAGMIGMIGVILASVSMLLALTTVVRANAKPVALMKAFGYTPGECSRAVLGGYRPCAYIGFAVGTVYQYVLIKSMLRLFSSTEIAVPDYEFNLTGFFLTLLSFAVVYELALFVFSTRMKKMPVKEIMLE